MLSLALRLTERFLSVLFVQFGRCMTVKQLSFPIHVSFIS